MSTTTQFGNGSTPTIPMQPPTLAYDDGAPRDGRPPGLGVDDGAAAGLEYDTVTLDLTNGFDGKEIPIGGTGLIFWEATDAGGLDAPDAKLSIRFDRPQNKPLTHNAKTRGLAGRRFRKFYIDAAAQAGITVTLLVFTDSTASPVETVTA